jgi:hypothetical protein
MAGYKVRLGDGSQIGPLEREMVRSWYGQGLITADSPVLRPGSTRWVPLGEALDIREWEAPPSPRKRPAARAPVAPEPASARSAGRRSPALGLPGLIRAAPRTLALGAGAAVLLAVALWALVLRDDGSAEYRPFAAEEQRFADQPLGIALEPPRGWLLLRKDNPLVAAPPAAVAVFAHPSRGGGAYMLMDRSRGSAPTLEAYLDAVLADRRAIDPGSRHAERRDLEVGKLPGRLSTGEAQSGGEARRELVAVWRDGWTHFALVAWFPAGRSSAERDVERLLSGFSTTGVFAARLEQAVEQAVREAPHLTPDVARTLMGLSEAGALDPEETFRRACVSAAAGLSSLGRIELNEMTRLTGTLYSTVPARERSRLAAYLDGLRSGRRVTSPEENREMCRIMKQAVLRLPQAQRARFRVLYEKSVLAGAGALRGAS